MSLFFSLVANSQQLAKKFNKQAVKSVNWGDQGKRFVDGFWEMAEKELQKKFTTKFVDSLVRYAASMYFASGFDNAKKETLKLYLVAEFDNNFGGVFRGVKYIVMVPYAENKELWSNHKTKPNDFFLVFSRDAVILQ